MAADLRAAIIADYHASTSHQAREKIIALVRSGHHVGPAPYGYWAARDDRRTCPAGGGAHLHLEPREAAAVAAIYSWRLDERLSLPRIVERLTADPDHCPPPIDTATGRPRPWTVGMVHAILTNPVYTGRTVWGRTRGGRPVPREQWIVSAPGAHRALIGDHAFACVAASFDMPRVDRDAA